jgi:hypothetical protein
MFSKCYPRRRPFCGMVPMMPVQPNGCGVMPAQPVMPVQPGGCGVMPVQPAGCGVMQPGFGGMPVQPGFGGMPVQPGFGGMPVQPGYGGMSVPVQSPVIPIGGQVQTIQGPSEVVMEPALVAAPNVIHHHKCVEHIQPVITQDIHHCHTHHKYVVKEESKQKEIFNHAHGLCGPATTQQPQADSCNTHNPCQSPTPYHTGKPCHTAKPCHTHKPCHTATPCQPATPCQSPTPYHSGNSCQSVNPLFR